MSPGHLTRREEEQLFAEYARTGDRKIEERLVESQLGLVGQMARAYQLKGVDRRDLFQEGVIGLMHAIRRFDPVRRVRLSTYAAHWIRAFQFRYLLANYRLVRLGTTDAQRRVFFRLSSLRARLAAAGIEPTPERIARILHVDADTVATTQARLDARDLSLDAPVGDGDTRRVDRMSAANRPPDDLLADEEIARIVRRERDRYRRTLSPRRRKLFDARWVDEERPTLKEMGDRLGVSRERARQLEQKMLTELGDRVRARLAA